MPQLKQDRKSQQAEREIALEQLLANARLLTRTLRGPFIVPAERSDPWSPLDFIKAFPRVAEITVGTRYGIKGILVLNGRLLRPNNRVRLREIGLKLEVTREWVRVVEMQILAMFANIFFVNQYVTSKFRIRDEFMVPLRDLERKVRNFRYGEFTFSDWARCLQRIWCLHPRDLGCVEPLILGILNYPFLNDCPLSDVPSVKSARQAIVKRRQ